jgi:hypothetical protein
MDYILVNNKRDKRINYPLQDGSININIKYQNRPVKFCSKWVINCFTYQKHKCDLTDSYHRNIHSSMFLCKNVVFYGMCHNNKCTYIHPESNFREIFINKRTFELLLNTTNYNDKLKKEIYDEINNKISYKYQYCNPALYNLCKYDKRCKYAHHDYEFTKSNYIYDYEMIFTHGYERDILNILFSNLKKSVSDNWDIFIKNNFSKEKYPKTYEQYIELWKNNRDIFEFEHSDLFSTIMIKVNYCPNNNLLLINNTFDTSKTCLHSYNCIRGAHIEIQNQICYDDLFKVCNCSHDKTNMTKEQVLDLYNQADNSHDKKKYIDILTNYHKVHLCRDLGYHRVPVLTSHEKYIIDNNVLVSENDIKSIFKNIENGTSFDTINTIYNKIKTKHNENDIFMKLFNKMIFQTKYTTKSLLYLSYYIYSLYMKKYITKYSLDKFIDENIYQTNIYVIYLQNKVLSKIIKKYQNIDDYLIARKFKLSLSYYIGNCKTLNIFSQWFKKYRYYNKYKKFNNFNTTVNNKSIKWTSYNTLNMDIKGYTNSYNPNSDSVKDDSYEINIIHNIHNRYYDFWSYFDNKVLYNDINVLGNKYPFNIINNIAKNNLDIFTKYVENNVDNFKSTFDSYLENNYKNELELNIKHPNILFKSIIQYISLGFSDIKIDINDFIKISFTNCKKWKEIYLVCKNNGLEHININEFIIPTNTIYKDNQNYINNLYNYYINKIFNEQTLKEYFKSIQDGWNYNFNNKNINKTNIFELNLDIILTYDFKNNLNKNIGWCINKNNKFIFVPYQLTDKLCIDIIYNIKTKNRDELSSILSNLDKDILDNKYPIIEYSKHFINNNNDKKKKRNKNKKIIKIKKEIKEEKIKPVIKSSTIDNFISLNNIDSINNYHDKHDKFHYVDFNDDENDYKDNENDDDDDENEDKEDDYGYFSDYIEYEYDEDKDNKYYTFEHELNNNQILFYFIKKNDNIEDEHLEHLYKNDKILIGPFHENKIEKYINILKEFNRNHSIHFNIKEEKIKVPKYKKTFYINIIHSGKNKESEQRMGSYYFCQNLYIPLIKYFIETHANNNNLKSVSNMNSYYQQKVINKDKIIDYVKQKEIKTNTKKMKIKDITLNYGNIITNINTLKPLFVNNNNLTFREKSIIELFNNTIKKEEPVQITKSKNKYKNDNNTINYDLLFNDANNIYENLKSIDNKDEFDNRYNNLKKIFLLFSNADNNNKKKIKSIQLNTERLLFKFNTDNKSHVKVNKKNVMVDKEIN